MTLDEQIKKLKGELQENQGILAKAFEESAVKLPSGEVTYDMSKAKSLGETLSSGQKVEKINKIDEELNKIGKQLEEAQKAKRAADNLNKPAKSIEHPGGNDPDPDKPARKEYKSVGQQITENEIFKQWQTQQGQKTGSMEIKDFGLAELKTLFQTSAGWAPESIRTGKVVEAVTRPIQILDIIPTGSTGMAAVVYMEETTRTHASAEKAEGATYAESTFALTETSDTVRKITDSIPVTDEQLEDVAGVQSYLDTRLRFGIMQRLDNQVINGDGSAPNLSGILDRTGLQTQAKGTDPVPDAIYKAMTKVRVTGRAMPSAVIMHPNDWQGVRLLRTADGIYIWGSPAEQGPARIWGLPVVQSDAIAENKALTGDFANFCQLFERRGIIVEMGFTGSQFVEGKQTLRASLRVAFAVYRDAAFSEITGI